MCRYETQNNSKYTKKGLCVATVKMECYMGVKFLYKFPIHTVFQFSEFDIDKINFSATLSSQRFSIFLDAL